MSITAGFVAGDTLTFTPAGGITDTNAAPDVLALTGTATVAQWQSVLRSVQFSSTSDNPTNATRTVSFVVNDGTVNGNSAPKNVTVVPVNDAPVLTQPDAGALAYTENAAATVIAPNIAAADVDSTNLAGATITIGTGYVNGQDVLSLGTNPQNGITAGAFNATTGTLTLTGTATVANYQTALRDVRYANTSDNPTAAARTVTFRADDGAGVNNLSNIVSRDVTVTPVNDPPVAGDDSFTGVNAALANTRLVVGTTSTGPHLAVAGSVLSNDTDIDSPTSGFTAGPATISSANCAGCNNVTMEADGNFLYDPPAGFTGNDTFTYTVNDNDPDTPANQTDTATVTIEVVGPLVWYVDIDAAAPPAGQGGRSHSPFNTLAPLTTGGTADTLDGTGDIIFVGVDNAPATGPYEGGIVLEANQKLWGEPFGLNVDPTGARPSTQLVAATPATPVANNPNVRNTGSVGITLANGVDIQRVNAGITGASGTTGISGTSTTTATIGPNQLIHGNTTGIVLTGAAGGDITIGAAIFAPTGSVVRVENRSSGTVTFNGDITSTDGNGGVFLNGNTGAAIAFTGAINLAGTGPAGTTFTATGGGTITANNAANQITGFTGTTAGVNLNGVAIGTAGITFNNLTSAAAGVANGILLTNVAGTGAFTVNGGAITATTRALDVDGSTGNVTDRRYAHHLRHRGKIRRSHQPRPAAPSTSTASSPTTRSRHQPVDERHRPRPLRRRHHRLDRSQLCVHVRRERHPRRHRHQRRDGTEQHAHHDDRYRAQRRKHHDPRRRPDLPEHLRGHRRKRAGQRDRPRHHRVVGHIHSDRDGHGGVGRDDPESHESRRVVHIRDRHLAESNELHRQRHCWHGRPQLAVRRCVEPVDDTDRDRAGPRMPGEHLPAVDFLGQLDQRKRDAVECHRYLRQQRQRPDADQRSVDVERRRGSRGRRAARQSVGVRECVRRYVQGQRLPVVRDPEQLRVADRDDRRCCLR